MKFKKLAQVLLISGSILALGACSTNKHNGASAMDGSGEGGAMASGVGQGDEFGGTGGAGSRQSLQQRTFYFDYDRSEVREEYRPAINANADFLVAHPNAKVILEGHTDPRGSREYNVALGERRANAVADILRSKGVNPRQIRVVSYGAERLAVSGHSDQDYQQDRRAVIAYMQK